MSKNWKTILGVLCLLCAIGSISTYPLASCVYLIIAIVLFAKAAAKTPKAQTKSKATNASDRSQRQDSIHSADTRRTDISQTNKEAQKPIETNLNQKKNSYVINPQTMVFHRPSCSYAKKTMSFNKHHCDSRSAIIGVGYKPCKYCKP